MAIITNYQYSFNVLSDDLLIHLYIHAEDVASLAQVSKKCNEIALCDVFQSYPYIQFHMIIGGNLSAFERLINVQNEDSWYLKTKKACKYLNRLSSKMGLESMVLPKRNGGVCSTSLISLFKEKHQEIVEANFITLLEGIDPKGISLREWREKHPEIYEVRDIHFRSETPGKIRLVLLPHEIGQFKNLVSIHLFRISLENIPESIGNLINLKRLNLIGNQLKELPESLGKLTSLEHLFLSENRLECLPETIENLINLKVLDLHKNQLKELPLKIGNLNNLRIFHLWENPLNKLPESFKDLNNLRVLNIERIYLEKFPETFRKFTNALPLIIAKKIISTLINDLSNSDAKKMIEIFIENLQQDSLEDQSCPTIKMWMQKDDFNLDILINYANDYIQFH